MAYKLTNKSEALTRLNRPDLGLVIELAPGKSAEISDAASVHARQFLKDFNLELSPVDEAADKKAAEDKARAEAEAKKIAEEAAAKAKAEAEKKANEEAAKKAAESKDKK